MKRDKNNSCVIKEMLTHRGVKQVQIAKMLGVSRASVNQVITGDRKSSRIRQAIAFAVNVQVKELWPEQAVEERK